MPDVVQESKGTKSNNHCGLQIVIREHRRNPEITVWNGAPIFEFSFKTVPISAHVFDLDANVVMNMEQFHYSINTV